MNRETFAASSMPEPNTGCWLWMKYVHPNGYGMCFYNKRGDVAHRVAYRLWVGEIPKGLTIDHKCRVTSCVNPDHLEAVTQRVNTHRGTGPVAVNAAKTHCKRGHELSGDNLDVLKGKYGPIADAESASGLAVSPASSVTYGCRNQSFEPHTMGNVQCAHGSKPVTHQYLTVRYPFATERLAKVQA